MVSDTTTTQRFSSPFELNVSNDGDCHLLSVR